MDSATVAKRLALSCSAYAAMNLVSRLTIPKELNSDQKHQWRQKMNSLAHALVISISKKYHLCSLLLHSKQRYISERIVILILFQLPLLSYSPRLTSRQKLVTFLTPYDTPVKLEAVPSLFRWDTLYLIQWTSSSTLYITEVLRCQIVSPFFTEY